MESKLIMKKVKTFSYFMKEHGKERTKNTKQKEQKENPLPPPKILFEICKLLICY